MERTFPPGLGGPAGGSSGKCGAGGSSCRAIKSGSCRQRGTGGGLLPFRQRRSGSGNFYRVTSSAAKPPFYITTVISYPNGVPHIGHAYEFIATDAMARFKRLDGYDVFFLTGTDEHGQKMLHTAQKEGITPLALAKRNSDFFQATQDGLGISYDRFIRTTDA